MKTEEWRKVHWNSTLTDGFDSEFFDGEPLFDEDFGFGHVTPLPAGFVVL